MILSDDILYECIKNDLNNNLNHTLEYDINDDIISILVTTSLKRKKWFATSLHYVSINDYNIVKIKLRNKKLKKFLK